jgi:hypothetical protein
MCCCVNGSHPRRLEYSTILLHVVFLYVFSDHVSERNIHHNDSGKFSHNVQSHMSFQTDLPSECLPQAEHTRPFLPHCIIWCHIKYPLSVKGCWHFAHVYGLSTAWIINCRTADPWLNRLTGGVGGGSSFMLNSKHTSVTKPKKYPHNKVISASKDHKKCNATYLYMCII